MKMQLSWYLWLKAAVGNTENNFDVAVIKLTECWLQQQLSRWDHYNSLTVASARTVWYIDCKPTFYKIPDSWFLSGQIITQAEGWAVVELYNTELSELDAIPGVKYSRFIFQPNGLVFCTGYGRGEAQYKADSFCLLDLCSICKDLGFHLPFK